MPTLKFSPFEATEDFPLNLRLFQDSLTRLFCDPTAARPWSPAVDILEKENELVLQADLPGIDLKDIDIQLQNGTLSLKGERKFEREEKKNGFHRLERSYGSFVRHFTLPETVDTDQIKAEYLAGVLTITLPRKEIAKPKTIKVQVNNN